MLSIPPSGSWLVKRGWSVAPGHKHAHTNSYTARHHQEEMQHCTHSFSLPFLSLSTMSPLHQPESKCHENLCLCSKSLTLLHAIYLGLKPQRSCPGWLAPPWPRTTATAVYFQSVPRILPCCQKYSMLHYVWSFPPLQLHPYLSNFLFMGKTDLLNRKRKQTNKKKRALWRTCNTSNQGLQKTNLNQVVYIPKLYVIL